MSQTEFIEWWAANKSRVDGIFQSLANAKIIPAAAKSMSGDSVKPLCTLMALKNITFTAIAQFSQCHSLRLATVLIAHFTRPQSTESRIS